MNSAIYTPSDDEFIKQTLAGNNDAFGQLIARYQNYLYDLAFRLLRNETEAEDALQDALVEIYRHLADFRHGSRFSTWIYSIVLNRVRNKLRRNKIVKWRSLDVPRMTEEGEHPVEMAEPNPPLEMLMDRKLELETIHREVKTLPAHYQSIFTLHYFQGLPLEEVARKLHRPIGTIKVYLHRARKILYKKWHSDERFAPAGMNSVPAPVAS